MRQERFKQSYSHGLRMSAAYLPEEPDGQRNNTALVYPLAFCCSGLFFFLLILALNEPKTMKTTFACHTLDVPNHEKKRKKMERGRLEGRENVKGVTQNRHGVFSASTPTSATPLSTLQSVQPGRGQKPTTCEEQSTLIRNAILTCVRAPSEQA